MLSKKELIAKFAETSGYKKTESEQIINDMIQVFEDAMIEDGGIQLTGIITIGTKVNKSKTVMNPQTKKPMQTKESTILYVKTGKTLKNKLNG